MGSPEKPVVYRLAKAARRGALGQDTADPYPVELVEGGEKVRRSFGGAARLGEHPEAAFRQVPPVGGRGKLGWKPGF
jgi:hypothetical protein